MKPEILKKDNSGEYVWTSYGEAHTVFLTLRHLLAHYLKAALKMEVSDIKKKLSELPEFVDKRISGITDLTKELPNLAVWIGDKNIERIANYFGKNFLTVLEKIQAQVRNQELPKLKERHDNPYWTPSYQLLGQFSSQFIKSKKLIWPLPNPTKEKIKETPMPSTLKPVSSLLPSEKMLKKLGSFFTNAPKLQNLFNSEPADSVSPKLESKTISFTEKKSDVSKFNELPSSKLLKIWSQQKLNSYKDSKTEEFKGIINISNFVNLIDKYKNFIQTKDLPGYKSWYANLSPIEKITLVVYLNIKKEANGQTVNWGKIRDQSLNYGLTTNNWNNFLNEINIYKKLLSLINSTLQDLKISSSSFYNNFIKILDHKKSDEQCERELEILLLTEAHRAEKVRPHFFSIIKQAKAFYKS